MHKHLGHALAQSSLAAVLRALKTSAQVPGTQHLLRSCAMVLRLYVHIDETQSLFLAFDLYIILYACNKELVTFQTGTKRRITGVFERL